MPVDLCDHGADWGLPLAARAQGLAQEKNSKFQVVSTECISLLHHCKVEKKYHQLEHPKVRAVGNDSMTYLLQAPWKGLSYF